MQQKIQDLVSLLKSDRKAQVIAVVCVLFLAYALLADHTPRKKMSTKKDLAEGAGEGGKSELIDDVLASMASEVRNLSEMSQKNAETLQNLEKEHQGFQGKTADLFRKILEQMAENEAKRVALAPQPNMPGIEASEERTEYPVNDINLSPTEPLELDTIGFEDKAVVPPPPPAKEKIAFVGAGDSVRLKLLAGVRAPTDGTPYPVVFQLAGDVYGPDGSALPLGEARVIAAAQGSLVDSRVLFRLSSLNLRLPSGRNQVIPVDGWVVGEDGIRGMDGILIDPFGKAIGAAGLAGALSGFGQAVSSGETTTFTGFEGSQTVVTGDDMKFAAGQAASGAANAYSRLIEERLRLLVPHVEVLSGREATAVFSKSFSVSGLFEELDSDDYDGMASMN
jgi:hypothetical protein